MRVLLTGGTGKLGRRAASELTRAGLTVRILTRHRPPSPDQVYEWAQGDYVSGEGLAQAFDGVESVVHAAHDPQHPQRDLAGAARLHSYSRAAGVKHFVQVGIVGAAQVPGFGYYAAKTQAEHLLEGSGLRFSIFRATQFHSFVASLLSGLTRWPLVLVPAGRLQPVDINEVAAALAQHVLRGQPGVEEFAGPQIRGIEELTRQVLSAQHRTQAVQAVRLPLPLWRAIERGALTSLGAGRGHLSFCRWLQQQSGVRADQA